MLFLITLIMTIIIIIGLIIYYFWRPKVEQMSTYSNSKKQIKEQLINNLNSQLSELYAQLKQYKPIDPQYDAIIKQIDNLQLDMETINHDKN